MLKIVPLLALIVLAQGAFLQEQETQRKTFHLETRPNDRQLFAEAPEGICPADIEATRLGLYEDMRVGIGVRRESALGGKAIILAFPIEAVQEWQSLLQQIINQLKDETL